jgi:hypothetical protein
MDGSPLIRIEFERMRQSVVMAITERQIAFDEMFQQALDEACNPERVQAELNREVRASLDRALKEEIGNFFKWGGDGRRHVRDAVVEWMDKYFWEEEDGSNTAN